ncbi:YdhK family protein [Sutcliffiella horikoshii]|uniref:YdhK family protein n=1 Tax=Sutcliffiella horikoshii TaxID=79883 RepID=UPI001CBDA14B|nr:YdhK family protein [Sutcliffiella horikoshii]UAL48267.1 YdhK family protein [Sutcliffiella horikoshii]
MKKRKLLGALTMAAAITLSGCAAGDNEEAAPNNNQANNAEEEESHDGGHGDHSGMDMSGSGEVPEGLKEKENPTFEVGSTATITEAHMPGMEGAEATIVGAYETTVYSISYDPTDGGERVEDHKWIIHEEVKDAQEEPYEVGDEVEVDADHMEGMQGATATIDSAEETTVYMVDFTLTDSGEEVTNHKWVTESELSKEE